MSVSSSEKVQVVTENGIATVTINNPGANTWDLESLPALEAVVHALDDRSDVRALIITGNGEKFFSAGADLNLFGPFFFSFSLSASIFSFSLFSLSSFSACSFKVF